MISPILFLFVFGQTGTPTTPTTTTTTTQQPSTSNGACSQINEFNSCQDSFKAQKIQTCDRLVQSSEEIKKKSCEVEVMKQVLSCYNFCNTDGSGNERQAYAKTVDSAKEELKALKDKNKPAPSANDEEPEPEETEDSSEGSRPNGVTNFGSDSMVLECTLVYLVVGVL